MAKAVRRDEHKMHAFVRFREVASEDGSRFVAWFEPDASHRRTGGAVLRQTLRQHGLVDPHPGSLRALGRQELSFSAGVPKSDAPAEDALEDIWRSYYASIFNPARLKTKAMQTEMPKKYWRNLPEASLIKPLIDMARARPRP